MNSLAMRLRPRNNRFTKLTLETAAVVLMVLVLLCISINTAFADPIGDLTGGTAPSQVTTPLKNALAIVAVVAAAMCLGVVLAALIILGLSGGESKLGKGMLIWGGIALAIISGLSSYAQWSVGLFNGLTGVGSTPASTP